MPGEGPWDPIGFSKLHENIQGSEHAGVVPSQQWMREAEIKHGRVAMLAFTGALVQSYGMHFDGKLNGMFYEKGVNPFEATPSAFATNPMGMAQILLFIGLPLANNRHPNYLAKNLHSSILSADREASLPRLESSRH